MVHRRTRASTRIPRLAALGVPLASLLLLWSGSALALDPSLDVSQYAHTAWRIRDGFISSKIFAIAQTPDGYLWLGTDLGLLRFDGVRTVPWNPAWGQLPSNYIHSLLVARDGTLWIGTLKGLASWKDGKLSQYPEVAGRSILPLLQDQDGTIWFGAYPGVAALCRIAAGNAACETAGSSGQWVGALHEDRSGNLWVITAQAGAAQLRRWKPGAREEYSIPDQVAAVGEDDRGAILLAAPDGVKQLADGRIVSHPVEGLTSVSRPRGFFRSSDGSLWIGTFNGLVHVHGGRSDVFTVAHGLSGENVFSMYEDREGSVWVSTSGGLDRFREYTFPRITADQGLSSSNVWGVLATPDGSVWMAASDGLNRWRAGRASFFGRRAERRSIQGTRASSGGRLAVLDARLRSLGVDDKGRLWAATRDGMFVLEADGFARVTGLPATETFPMVPDRQGGMWVPATEGLFHWRDGTVSHFPWSRFGPKGLPGPVVLPEPAKGGLWLGFLFGGLSYVEDGRVLATYAAANGLGSGRVTHLRRDDRGAIWVSTEGGLSRVHDGQIATLAAKNGLPCDAVHWSIEDDHGSVWLYMPCGLVRIGSAELDAWASDAGRKTQTAVFDASDGVITIGAAYSYGPSVTKTPDGRIWFTGSEGVTIIDPLNIRRNDQPPPVHIEAIVADGTTYPTWSRTSPLRLPSRVRDLEIDYTALSLRAPEKVRFRVKLEGQDKDWRELLNERHVSYTNLPPRSYRFLVKAANDSGVWNEEGASLAFTIPPAFYQTAWFRTLCVAALAGLLWGAYRVRISALERSRRILERHQVEITALNERLMKAQEEERGRIAGELHDGVLQQLATITLDLGTAKHRIPAESTGRTDISQAQQKLIELGREIRILSHEMHPAVLQEHGLAQALSSYCSEFANTRGIAAACEADAALKDLSRGCALALYRIAQEAMGNAAKHARAKHVNVRLEQADGMARLTVSDDGIGFVPEHAGQTDGLGLVNMRERVRQLGGVLEVESQPGRGTTIRAQIPIRRV